MMLHELAAVSAALAATRSRSEKVRACSPSACERSRPTSARRRRVARRRAARRQVSLGPGRGPRGAERRRRAAPSSHDRAAARALDALRAIAGKGSALAPRASARALASPRRRRSEQQFLSGLLLGELRQGALEGVMAEAIAAAAEVAAGRRAARQHARRRLGARCKRGAGGGPRRARAVPLDALRAGGADAREPGQGRGRGARGARVGRARVQARRRARADPQRPRQACAYSRGRGAT